MIINKSKDLYTSGRNNFGQLGNGDVIDVSTPKKVLSKVLFAASNHDTSYAITKESIGNVLWAWGKNTNYEYGEPGNTVNSLTPKRVSTFNDWVKVVAGFSGNAMALRANGDLYFTGAQLNSYSLIGGAVTNPIAGWTLIHSNVQDMSLGYYHSAIVTKAGELKTSGYGSYGQLGYGNTSNYNTWRLIFSSGVKSVACGHYTTSVIKEDGTLWSTGQAGYTGLTYTGQNHTSFNQVGTDNDWKRITTYAQTTIAMKTNGHVYGWGNTASYQLGFDPGIVTYLPRFIGGPYTDFSVGTSWITVTDKEGNVYFSGNSIFGAQGDGVERTNTALYRDFPFDDFVIMKSGTYFTLGLKSDGTLWGWGTNTAGELGVDTNLRTNIPLPTQIGTDSDWVDFSCGANHVLAKKADNSVWSWGNNSYGQRANGGTSSVNQHIPNRVGGLHPTSPVKKMLATDGACFVLHENGEVYAWGYNGYSTVTLNTNSSTNRYTPIKWPAAGVVDLAATNSNVIYVTNNGTTNYIYAMGYNGYYQIGNGVNNNPSSPIQITSGTTALDGVKVAVNNNTLYYLRPDGNLYAAGQNNYYQSGYTGNTSNLTSWRNTLTGVSDFVESKSYSMVVKRVNGDYLAFGQNTLNMFDTTNAQTSVGMVPTVIANSNSLDIVSIGAAHIIAKVPGSNQYKFKGYNSQNQFGIDEVNPTITTYRKTPYRGGLSFNTPTEYNQFFLNLYLIQDGPQLKTYDRVTDSLITIGPTGSQTVDTFMQYGLDDERIIDQHLINMIENDVFQIVRLIDQAPKPGENQLNNKTISITGFWPVNFDYKVDLISPNTSLISDWKTANVDISEVAIVPGGTVNTLQTYKVQVTVKQEDGFILTDVGTVILQNTKPTVTPILNGLTLRLIIEDPEQDDIQYQIKLNDELIFPDPVTGKQYTDLVPSPAVYERIFRSYEIDVGETNTFTVSVKDQFGTEYTTTVDMQGIYSGLMFHDATGDYYSTDVGTILKDLDMGILIASQTSTPVPVWIKNTHGFQVTNLKLWKDATNLPEGVDVELCKVDTPFEPVSKIEYDPTTKLSTGDSIKFYLRLTTTKDAVGTGSFDILVQGDPA